MLEKFFITCNEENHWTLTDATRADNKIIFLRDEYDKFWQKVLRGENFALPRYGDGERALMRGHDFSVDGWRTGGGVTALGKALLDSLTVDAPNFYYGISCPCCDSAAYYWYLRHIKSFNVTFSNIWVNANFKTFQKNFWQLKRDAVLITNWRGKDKTFGKLNVKRHYLVGDDCVKFFETDCAALINRIIAEVGHEKNLLYVVSAGPLSNVIIAELFKRNPDNCYVDFGSATDLMTHDKVTRPYMVDGTSYARQNCWMFDKRRISIDVDVVLSCYKRPQVLRQQLDAVKSQTLAPRRIFLYQDGIDGYYKVELNDRILGEFDACKISATNGGVWKRFEFAAEIAKSPYICMFDDDTIPGERWLENCHMNMMQQRGVFGVNGYVVTDFKDYRNNRLMAGIFNPNVKTCAVDFVGHSWFFEREILPWMLAKPWGKKYKICGEDMTISAAAKEHGIYSYIPPFPKNILSLWGELPQFFSRYGASEVAISRNPSNHDKMYEAFKEIHADGWQCLLEEKPAYINEFLSVFKQQQPPPAKKLKASTEQLLTLLRKKPSILFGERKYSAPVCKLFNLKQTQYNILDDDKNTIDLGRMFSIMRQGALHVFFVDAYEQLTPYFKKAGLREGVDFSDGRGLLIAVTNYI